MANYKVRVTLPYTTGLASDVAVNTFSVEGASGDLPDAFDSLESFYNSDFTVMSSPLCEYISPSVSRVASACSMAAYDRAAGPGAGPVATRAWTLGAHVGGKPFPDEVAMCLTFHADLTESLAIKARRRGRIFLGPLGNETGEEVTGSIVRPSAVFRDDCNFAMAALQDLLEIAGIPWEVWSEVDAVGRPVVGGWVDNSFDTMRSRGPAPTVRETWVD